MDKAVCARIVSATGWLSQQPEAFRTEIVRRSHLRRFEAGETLYLAGDPPGGVFGLADGVLTIALRNGRVATVKRPGYWIGETAAMRRQRRTVTLAAATRAHTLYLPLSEFERMIADAETCRRFASLSLQHLDEALEIIACLMAPDAVGRVAGRLLALTDAQSIGEGTAMRLTQRDLADMCGISRQTANRVLIDLGERQVLATRYGTVTILDARTLRILAGEVG
ncbi:MAG: Crp/Fnr family transcriptional regulator [Acetobacteraceae bacterium]|nr:Crp/Fnr family transcriptional regulator [Pseudomonadota bacterium]